MLLEEVSTDVLPPVLPRVCVVDGVGVGDDDGLPWGGLCALSWVSTAFVEVCGRRGRGPPLRGLPPLV